MEAQLHGFEARLHDPDGGLGGLCSRAQCSRGGIKRQPRRIATKQTKQRLVRKLSREIPKGTFERPQSSVVKAQVVDDARMPIQVERIATDEQILVTGKSGHRFAAGNTFPSLVVANAHDGGGEIGPRAAVPSGMEGRRQIDYVPRDLNGTNDAHGCSTIGPVIPLLGPRRQSGFV